MATRSRRTRRSEPTQAVLPFRPGRGGRRAGAGRKPKGDKPGVDHRQREALAARHPAHVTLKLGKGLPAMRRKPEDAVLRAAFAAGCRGPARASSAGRAAFRLCQYSIQDDHLHFLVEADHRTALARGLQGLLIRIAKALNKLWQRRGKVFADRYHARILTTPLEVRHVLRYVFGNARKHAAQGAAVAVPQAIDVFSSAPWFDGFRERLVVRNLPPVRPVAEARSWLLTQGWRRHGLLSVHELPSTA